MRELLTWLLAALAALTACEGLACDTGRVFEDANGNGVRDPAEPGIAGVGVSDGRTLVATDASGVYRFPRGAGADVVFVVKPATHALPRRADGLPDGWRQANAAQPGGCGDFALHKSATAQGHAGLRVLVFADPQPKSARDVSYYARDIVAPLLPAPGADAPADLGLTLGDIVDDDVSLYPAMNRETARLGVPWLHAAGNHDIDVDARDDPGALRTFRKTYGPDTFAWEDAMATFVVLDDVVAMPGQSPAYIGGLRPDQFAFLEGYLPSVRKDRLLVLAMHMPLFEAPGRDTFRDADRERLFALLRRFPHVLLLTAHNHTQRHVMHGPATGWHGPRPLHEYNVGAASGAYWSGVADAAGIPDATMADGTPNGYATLEIERDGAYRLAWHAARGQGGDGLRLHAPAVLRQDAYPAFGVYANVFMGMDDTRVEYRIDDGPWRAMRRVAQTDPWLRAQNVRDDEATALRGYDRSPEAEPSAHLWRGTLPTDLAAGAHAIDVRAFDPWRGELRASAGYRLQDASP